jgi:two-component system, NarL family, sensor kinase
MKARWFLLFLFPWLASPAQTCDTVLVKKLYNQAKELISDDVIKAAETAFSAYESVKVCPGTKHYYETVSILSAALHQCDRHDSVFKFLEPIVKNLPESAPAIYKAKLNQQLCNSLISLSKFEPALKHGLAAIKFYEQANDKRRMANMYVNIANIYQQQYNFKQADKFLRSAEQMAGQLKDSSVFGNVYNTMGILYAEHQQLDSAEKFFLRSTAIREALNDKTSIVWNYSNLGGVYTLKKEPVKALVYFEKAYKKFAEDSNIYGLSSVALNMGEVYMQLKKPVKALEYYQYARKYSAMVNDLDNMENIYTNLSNYYDEMGDLKTAMKYSDSLVVLMDTVYGRRLDESIAEMQTRFDVEKKDLEIAKNKTEMELQDKRNQFKNTVIISILVFFVLLITVIWIFYRKKQIEQKAKLAEEIAQQKELRSKAIIEAEEKERRRIAQDLHDGIGQILSAAKLNLSNYQSKAEVKSQEEKDALKNVSDLIDDSVKEVRAVSHNMMPNTLIKLGLASAVREFITKIGNIPNFKVDLEIVGLDKRLPEQTETVFYRVIQEIVNNIIKHSKANHISLQLIKHENEMTVMIEDNGVGFDTGKINEFQGIGLKNIISRIEFLNGRVDFDSTPGHGTNVIIEVPLV